MFLHRIYWRRLRGVTLRSFERSVVLRDDFLISIIIRLHRLTSFYKNTHRPIRLFTDAIFEFQVTRAMPIHVLLRVCRW
jgi:hypothetical protein